MTSLSKTPQRISIPTPVQLTLSAMATAIQGIYGMGASIDSFIDDHISQMKTSENDTIAKTGRVIEMAKFGFGLGYMSSVAIIAVGQLILGNPLNAVGTVATAATLTNPIAMTCAAVGAIYYGWSALSDAEKNAILEKLRIGLEIGIETIRAIIGFVVRTTKEVLSSENITEFKEFIKIYATKFGKSLSDVTGKMVDMVKDAAQMTARKSNELIASTSVVLSEVASNSSQAAAATTAVAKSALASTGGAIGTTSNLLKNAVGKVSDSASSAAKGILEKAADATQQLNMKMPKTNLPTLPSNTSSGKFEADVSEGKKPL